MRKPFFCICENKDADQLRGKRESLYNVTVTRLGIIKLFNVFESFLCVNIFGLYPGF